MVRMEDPMRSMENYHTGGAMERIFLRSDVVAPAESTSSPPPPPEGGGRGVGEAGT
jgi:hypothetical protein